jgi:hypothetical protein
VFADHAEVRSAGRRSRPPADAASLGVSLGERSQTLSDDPDYQRFERSKGILLRTLDVKPGSGKDATSLEFDKSQTLQDITREQKARVRSEFIENSKRGIRGKTFKK